jgi:hypothetical protein
MPPDRSVEQGVMRILSYDPNQGARIVPERDPARNRNSLKNMGLKKMSLKNDLKIYQQEHRYRGRRSPGFD